MDAPQANADDGTSVIRPRVLSGSGRIHWLQQPDAYRAALRDFYAVVPTPV
jgi:hypothetical protein